MTKAQREEAMNEALTLSAKGKTVQDIADELGVAWHTASTLIDDAIANRAEHRSTDKEREKAIANYRAVIDYGWQRLDAIVKPREPGEEGPIVVLGNSMPGMMNAIRGAQERIDKLTGAEAPIKRQNVDEEIVVEWEDLDRIAATDEED